MKTALKIFISISLFLSIINESNAQETKNTHKDSLNTIVSEYYDLNLKIFQIDSRVDYVDQLFHLFTSDFTYVHPKYGGIYTRESLYNGYVRNQKNVEKDGTLVEIQIANKIVGLNALVVERRYIEKKDNQISTGDLQMTLFEFKDGKIFRIFEYW